MAIVQTILALAFVGFAAWLTWGPRVRTRTRRRSVCEHCGYDLRGTPLRCPECGHATALARAKAFARLRNDWPAAPIAPRTPGPDETYEVVFSSPDHMLVDLLRQHLDIRGVAAQIVVDGYGVDPTTGARSGGFSKLIIYSGDRETALEILRRLLPEEEQAQLSQESPPPPAS